MIRDRNSRATFEKLIWPLRLTWAGLWCERLTRAFWPLWTLVIGALSVLAFGLQDHLPIEAVWIGGVAALGGSLWALVTGLRRFHRPGRADALARLDQALPGHPIAALTDTQAIGATDAASLAVWEAHRSRMAARAALAKPVAPDLRLAGRDPFALRYVALTALVMALLFGSLWRAGSVVGMTPGGDALASGPVWEGWAQPPLHTGKPALYLNDITQNRLDLPTGTRIQLRLYGEVGALTVRESVSNRTDPPPASDSAQAFEVAQTGTVEIAGPGGRQWDIVAIPDSAPAIVATGEISREAQGEMAQAFTATDDYGVISGQATIALDLPSVSRAYGLSVDPEPREPIVLDLPMPITGDRTEFTETLVDDLSKHPFANLPVTITFAATDAVGQTGQSAPLSVTLPGRRFFDPLAAALIETRRDLLWSTANATRSAQILKAVTHLPEGFIRNERAYLRLRVLLRDLDTAAATGLAAGKRAHLRDELQQLDWGRKGRMRGGRDTVFAHRHAADRGDFRRDLRRRQDAAMARLCALAELQLHKLDLGVRRDLGELFGIKPSIGPAAPEVARPDFPDQIAPGLAVIGGNAAFAGVMGKAALPGSPVQRAHRIGGQRPIAHCGNVQDRGRIGLCAGAAVPDGHAMGVGADSAGGDGMVQPFVFIAIDVVLRAKGPLVQFALCPLIDKGPLVSRERSPVLVTFKEVLADFGADPFQQKPQMAGNGIVAQDRMPRLDQVVHAQHGQKQAGQCQKRVEQSPARNRKAEHGKAQNAAKGQGQRKKAHLKRQGQKRHGTHPRLQQASGYQTLMRLW